MPERSGGSRVRLTFTGDGLVSAVGRVHLRHWNAECFDDTAGGVDETQRLSEATRRLLEAGRRGGCRRRSDVAALDEGMRLLTKAMADEGDAARRLVEAMLRRQTKAIRLTEAKQLDGGRRRRDATKTEERRLTGEATRTRDSLVL
ncbi:pentatricopeptide repeat (PPR-like) superfamily protein [Striga asiatica]|uniref:Pentatricopeptide repeat (PPR-like) superfamily protein n=1 Tax=Striga asiatica TaxID=4170 RepID=A0A5A7PC01_STRAF|nr:pentatricopeptide repeat (PPR-like) superfamily protein [Striga asiatica]